MNGSDKAPGAGARLREAVRVDRTVRSGRSDKPVYSVSLSPRSHSPASSPTFHQWRPDSARAFPSARCRCHGLPSPFPLYSPGFLAHFQSVSNPSSSISPGLFTAPPETVAAAAIVARLCRRSDSTRAPTKSVPRTAEHPSCHPNHSPTLRRPTPLQFRRSSVAGFPRW